MTQKFIVVYASVRDNKEKNYSEIMSYGYAFSKSDKAIDAINIAREKVKGQGILVGVWTNEWTNPNAEYILRYADPYLKESEKKNPVGDYAMFVRKASNAKPNRRRATLVKPYHEKPAIVVVPPPPPKPKAEPYCPFTLECAKPSNLEEKKQ